MNCKGNKREAERPGGYFRGIHEVACGLGIVAKEKEKWVETDQIRLYFRGRPSKTF